MKTISRVGGMAVLMAVGAGPLSAGTPGRGAGQWRVEPQVVIGLGLKSHEVGVTTDGQSVKISAGGGVGAGISLGYGLTESTDFEVLWGYQRSTLSPDVTNASGSFDRYLTLATVKYKIPLVKKEDSWLDFKIGGGVGQYPSGKFKTDFGSVGAGRSEVRYKAGQGFHLTADFERYLRRWSLSAGVRYSVVSYQAKSFEFNGSAQPVSNLKPEFEKFKGDGIDFVLALKF